LATWLVVGCSGDAVPAARGPSPVQRATPSALVASLRARPRVGWISSGTSWARSEDRLRPSLAPRKGAFRTIGEEHLVVDVPARADGALRLSHRALPDFWLELAPEGLDRVEGAVVEDAVVFAEAGRATDVVQVARRGAIEELRVLHGPEASRRMRWSLRKGPGVSSVRVADDGSIVAAHTSGTAHFVAPRPFAIDDSGADVPLTVRVDASSLELELDVARAKFPVVVDPQWAATGSMTTPRVLHQATLLNDGRVLVTGGTTYYMSPSYTTTEIFDETAGTFTAGPNMSAPRAGHTATLLLDGRVLVAGGYRKDGTTITYLSTTEIFDPTTNTFTAGPTMPGPRGHHSAVRTASGHVALVGGRKDETTTGFLTTGLDFNPTTSTYRTSIVGAMQDGGRYWVPATLLSPNSVLCAGGFSSTGQKSSVEIFYPEYEMAAYWSPGTAMSTPRAYFELATTPAGDVLAAGGSGMTAEIFRKATSKWEPAGASATGHSQSTSTLLDEGRILVVGGGDPKADIYDPLAAGPTTAWKPAGSMTAQRMWHRAAKLKSGRVLLVGGHGAGSMPLSSAEIFTALPQGDACTDSGECASGFCTDGHCCDKACDGQCEACDLAKRGTCGNVIGPPHGMRTKCGGAASCVDDVAIGEPVCDGSGSCAAPAPASCLPFKCAGGACKTSCTSNADCAGANVCFDGTCAARQGVCSADRTSTTLSGQTTPTSCGAYLCREADGTCGTSCTTTGDCASGNACDPATSKCIPTAGGTTDDSGGCAVGGPRDPGRGVVAALLGACIALSRLRRRAHRARSAPR